MKKKLGVLAFLCVSAALCVSACIKLDDPPKDINVASKDADSPLISADAGDDGRDEGRAGGGDRHRHLRQHGPARRQG